MINFLDGMDHASEMLDRLTKPMVFIDRETWNRYAEFAEVYVDREGNDAFLVNYIPVYPR